MKNKIFGAALLVATVLQPAIAQQEPAATPVEYSLLTPALSGDYFVAIVGDVLTSFALGGHTSSVRQASLRKLVAREGYDASSSLAIALRDELQAAGFPAEVEPVRRAKAGQPQGLMRADLPADANGRFLLDVVLDSIGLAASSNGAEWQPAFKMSWRVLSPSGDIIVPTHVFWHGPFVNKDGIKTSRTSCGLPYFNGILEQPQVLWDCFDLGLREASRALIPQVRRKQTIALHGVPKEEQEAAAERQRACGKIRRPRDALDGECDSQ